MFKVIKPSAQLASYVKQYWFLSTEEAQRSSQRMVPFGCIGIAFHLGESTFSLSAKDYIPKSHIWGQTTSYTELVYSGNIKFIAVILEPAGAMAVLGMPPKEMEEQVVDMDIFGDYQWLELQKRLHESPDIDTSIELIEKVLRKKIQNNQVHNYNRLNTIIGAMKSGRNDIGELSDMVYLGKKQFRRIFCETVGINPKDYIRVLRFQQTMYLLQVKPDYTLTEIAEECGYYDKSHLLKEMKTLSGLSPKEFISVCDPFYSEYHALFRSAFIDNPCIKFKEKQYVHNKTTKQQN